MNDRAREIHGVDDGAWRVSDGEVLAELREDRARIVSGDLSGVAPWSTAEQALAEIDLQIAAIIERRKRPR